MSRTSLLQFVKAVWVLLAILVLVVTLYGFDGKPNSDIGIFLGWSLLAISFPLSLVIAMLFSTFAIVAHEIWATTIPVTHLSLIVSWIAFVAAGYWQWFVLLPWLVRKLKERFAIRSSSAG